MRDALTAETVTATIASKSEKRKKVKIVLFCKDLGIELEFLRQTGLTDLLR